MGLDDHPEWGEWARLPVSDRPEAVRGPINEALLKAAFGESLHPSRGRPLGQAVLYFYAYGLCVWLMVNAWFGFFEEYFGGDHAKVRYYSDAAYWLYLVHIPIQFEMSLWLGEYSWHPMLKFLVYLGGALVVSVPSYHFLVRSTWVGHWLNGRRYQKRPFLESALLPVRQADERGTG